MNGIQAKAAKVTVLLTEGAAIAFPHVGWTVSRGGLCIRRQHLIRRRQALAIAHANDNNSLSQDRPLRPSLRALPGEPASSPAPRQGEMS